MAATTPARRARHAAAFAGRSAFLVFVRLPEGRAATALFPGQLYDLQNLDHATARDLGQIVLNPRHAAIPWATQLALVRRTLLVDDGES